MAKKAYYHWSETIFVKSPLFYARRQSMTVKKPDFFNVAMV